MTSVIFYVNLTKCQSSCEEIQLKRTHVFPREAKVARSILKLVLLDGVIWQCYFYYNAVCFYGKSISYIFVTELHVHNFMKNSSLVQSIPHPQHRTDSVTSEWVRVIRVLSRSWQFCSLVATGTRFLPSSMAWSHKVVFVCGVYVLDPSCANPTRGQSL